VCPGELIPSSSSRRKSKSRLKVAKLAGGSKALALNYYNSSNSGEILSSVERSNQSCHIYFRRIFGPLDQKSKWKRRSVDEETYPSSGFGIEGPTVVGSKGKCMRIKPF
jgi:hypothetical protein